MNKRTVDSSKCVCVHVHTNSPVYVACKALCGCLHVYLHDVNIRCLSLLLSAFLP